MDATQTMLTQARALGQRIRAQRIELRVTQEDLATIAGVSVRFIGDLERGKPTVRLSGVLAVCQALGLELLPS